MAHYLRKLNARDEMYRLLPAALKVIEESMTCSNENTPHQTKVHSAWKLMAKLCPDLKAVDISGDLDVKAKNVIEFK